MHTRGGYTYEDSKLWGKFGIKFFNRFVFRSHSLLSLSEMHPLCKSIDSNTYEILIHGFLKHMEHICAVCVSGG